MWAVPTSWLRRLAARLLQGIGAAATRVLTISIVRDCYAGRRMARVMSLVFMVFMTVPMIAPAVGAVTTTDAFVAEAGSPGTGDFFLRHVHDQADAQWCQRLQVEGLAAGIV